jgi:hypothetical protein
MPPRRLSDVLGPSGETREWLILASIRAGGYPHVAAEAYGVPAERFLRWVRRARKGKVPRRIRRLIRSVNEAAAQARLKAEINTCDADPRFWLRHGPGKETRQAPGWAALAKPCFGAGGDEIGSVLQSAGFRAMLAAVLRALEPYPEARLAAAEALGTVP